MTEGAAKFTIEQGTVLTHAAHGNVKVFRDDLGTAISATYVRSDYRSQKKEQACYHSPFRRLAQF